MAWNGGPGLKFSNQLVEKRVHFWDIFGAHVKIHCFKLQRADLANADLATIIYLKHLKAIRWIPET